jgi:hypothetical protein
MECRAKNASYAQALEPQAATGGGPPALTRFFIFQQKQKFSRIWCYTLLQVFEVVRVLKRQSHARRRTTFADTV